MGAMVSKRPVVEASGKLNWRFWEHDTGRAGMLIISTMIHLNVVPSPSPDVLLDRYNDAVFPDFSKVFDDPATSRLPRFLLMDPDEASLAVVLQNQSEKAITALKYRWEFTDESGKQRSSKSTSDSYTMEVFRAVAEPHAMQLISPSSRVDRALIDQVASGGGGGILGSGSGGRLPDGDQCMFAIDLIMFEDGETAGSDPDGYLSELRARKPAAEFVARQIRLADAEGRDVTPVLMALSQIPSLGRIGLAQGDPFVHCTRNFAEEYLRSGQLGRRDRRESVLKWLEQIPAVPKFYRRTK
jgi:hypothetical protein